MEEYRNGGGMGGGECIEDATPTQPALLCIDMFILKIYAPTYRLHDIKEFIKFVYCVIHDLLHNPCAPQKPHLWDILIFNSHRTSLLFWAIHTRTRAPCSPYTL